MVHAFPHTLSTRSGVHDPVDHVAAVMVEERQLGFDGIALVLSEADEEEIRRKAQEYADMLREEKRAEGRSSSLNDGRLKKEA